MSLGEHLCSLLFHSWSGRDCMSSKNSFLELVVFFSSLTLNLQSFFSYVLRWHLSLSINMYIHVLLREDVKSLTALYLASTVDWGHDTGLRIVVPDTFNNGSLRALMVTKLWISLTAFCMLLQVTGMECFFLEP